MKKFYGLFITVFITGWLNTITPRDISYTHPLEFVQLKQNFPNPYNSSTQIGYYLSYRTYVEINIYNILGVKLQTYSGAEQEKCWFNAGNLPAGLYVYEIDSYV